MTDKNDMIREQLANWSKMPSTPPALATPERLKRIRQRIAKEKQDLRDAFYVGDLNIMTDLEWLLDKYETLLARMKELKK